MTPNGAVAEQLSDGLENRGVIRFLDGIEVFIYPNPPVGNVQPSV